MGRPSLYTPEVDLYALMDPRDRALRYVGKARKATSRFKSHLRDSTRRNTPVYRWIRELAQLGLQPEMEIIATVPEADWPHWERRIIAKLRAIPHVAEGLLNVATGGNQPFCPPEVRKANGLKLMESYRQRARDAIAYTEVRLAECLSCGDVAGEEKEAANLADLRVILKNFGVPKTV